MGSHLDGLLPEYHPSFNAPHHYMMQGTRSVDSGSPWHETPLPLPALACKLDNLTAFYCVTVAMPPIATGFPAVATAELPTAVKGFMIFLFFSFSD